MMLGHRLFNFVKVGRKQIDVKLGKLWKINVFLFTAFFILFHYLDIYNNGLREFWLNLPISL